VPERLDLEAEYNNRARVPEHPALIEGWRRDAASYRAAIPPVTIPYGPGERQRIDVFTPTDDSARATVMFIHGGYWQGLDRSFFSHLARGLNAHGVAVAVPSYDLCPEVGVADIVEAMRTACLELARFGRPVVAAGHSAGGHLAACLLATNWRAIGDEVPEHPLSAAYCLSGLFDLPPLVPTSVNRALGLDEVTASALSPVTWTPPTGRPLVLDAVVGGDESTEYKRQSREIVEVWRNRGVETRYEEVPGANHFTIVAPLADPDSRMVARLASLARR
jgi:arylformamidase